MIRNIGLPALMGCKYCDAHLASEAATVGLFSLYLMNRERLVLAMLTTVSNSPPLFFLRSMPTLALNPATMPFSLGTRLVSTARLSVSSSANMSKILSRASATTRTSASLAAASKRNAVTPADAGPEGADFCQCKKFWFSCVF